MHGQDETQNQAPDFGVRLQARERKGALGVRVNALFAKHVPAAHCALDSGEGAGGLSPAELLTQLVDLRGQVRSAERERDHDRLVASQLTAQAEAKAALMQD